MRPGNGSLAETTPATPRRHCKWGDGAAIWDDILPPVPEDIWRENLAAVAAALEG